MNPLLRLPIDQYGRYRLLADIVDRLGGSRERLDVLDVGGRTGLSAEFLTGHRVYRVDLEPSDRPEGLVLGDGARLPFRDGSFDVVAACDTLEHVPPEAREAFVAECARVARRYVVLVGPFAGSRVRAAEARLRDFLRLKLDLQHRYLDEHARYGLPSRRATRADFERAGARTLSVGHGSLQRWLAVMCLEIYLESDPVLQGFAPEFYEFYNSGMYALDAQGPCYRHGLVAALNGAQLPDLEGLFGDVQSPAALFEALERFTPDLAAFDRERESWREERRRFVEVVEELTRERASEQEELRKVGDSWRTDRGQYESVIASLETRIEEHAQVIEALRANLEAERVQSATLRQLRESENADREAQSERARMAEAQLSASVERLAQAEAAARADHERQQALLSELRAESDALRGEVATLAALREAELADRDAVAARVDRAERDARQIERDRIELEGEARVLREALEHERHLREAADARAVELAALIERERVAIEERAEQLVELERIAHLSERDEPELRARFVAVSDQLEASRRSGEAQRAEKDALLRALGALRVERERSRERIARLDRQLRSERARLASIECGPSGDGLVAPASRTVDLRSNRARARRRGRRDSRRR
jgi:hypothetical protein